MPEPLVWTNAKGAVQVPEECPMVVDEVEISASMRHCIGLADACELMEATFAFPTAALAQALIDGSYEDDCIGCLSDIGVGSEERAGISHELAAFKQRDADELLDTLKKGHSILYLAPGLKVPVWPYESPFFTMRLNPNAKPSLYRTQIALDIEELMRKAGVVFEDARTESPDSIWNEFAYLSYLYGSLAQALLQDEVEKADELRGHIDVFVDKHVLNWFDDFMASSVENAPLHSHGTEYATFARIGAVVTKELVADSRSRSR